MNILKNTNVGTKEIYDKYTNISRLKDLYKTDIKAYQKVALEWDVEYRRHIRAMVEKYSFRYLEDDMTVVLQDFIGWNKPRFLLNERLKTGFEFMDEKLNLKTVNHGDINWNSLKRCSSGAISVAEALFCPYPILITKYIGGRAEVVWTLNPDGMFFMDEDGFGMETGDDGIEVKIIGYIDRNGNVVKKFSYYG